MIDRFARAGIYQDIPIWEHKKYREHPVLVKGDGEIAEYRRWVAQFYSWPDEPETGENGSRAQRAQWPSTGRPGARAGPSIPKEGRTRMGNILVISADTHAGLPDADYKNYLATQYHEAFEDDLRARHAAGDAVRQSMGADDNEFVQEWYEENEEGLRGGWDAGRRDKELDADGVVGEVIFPDADAVRGGASAPFGAGLSLSGEGDPSLAMAGARATISGSANCAATVRTDARVWPSCPSSTTSTRRWPKFAGPTPMGWAAY